MKSKPQAPPANTEHEIADVTIGRHRVGPSQPTFIVAEAGVNHDGSVDKALLLVDAACEAGADAVKFQMFQASDLVTDQAETAGYQRDATEYTSQRDLLKKLELSREEFLIVRDHCETRGVTFLATPFSSSELGRLIAMGAPAIKIASTDLTNHPLLNECVATGLPLIISTGAASEQEIDEAVARCKENGAGDRLVLLHCVSAYPTPMEAINLRAITTLRRKHGVASGLSDHTVSTLTGGWAVACGADLLEKHFTLDPTSPGPDHAMSLSPSQLREYIGHVRQAETALGDGRIGMTECQSEVRTVAGRSIVAATFIPAGTTISNEMMGLKRPGTGMPASDLPKLAGRCAVIDIPRDTLVSWDMLR